MLMKKSDDNLEKFFWWKIWKSDGRSRKLGEKFWWKILDFLILPGQIMTS